MEDRMNSAAAKAVRSKSVIITIVNYDHSKIISPTVVLSCGKYYGNLKVTVSRRVALSLPQNSVL